MQKKQKIRIAYVLRTEVRAGVEEHVLSLLQRLDTRRFQTYLVAPPKLIAAYGTDMNKTNTIVFPLKIKHYFDFNGMIKFFRFLKKNRIDIVNTHMFFTSFYYTPIAKLARVPITIETSHGVEKWRAEKGIIKRTSFIIDRTFSHFQRRILAVSHACKKDLIEIKGISPSKIVVIQNGRDLDNFKPIGRKDVADLRRGYGISEDEFIFGVLARLDFQKGHKYLLDAVAILVKVHQNFKVLFIGDGPLRNILQRRTRELGVEKFIVFTGFKKDVQRHLAMIDVMVLPSLYEGLPLGVIEAAAMERPVIATSVDGTPEAIIHGKTGLLVEPRNCQALFEAMKFALENKEVMAEMGRRGREFALEHFTLERQIKETESLYEALVNK